jgi:hypothetical protein
MEKVLQQQSHKKPCLKDKEGTFRNFLPIEARPVRQNHSGHGIVDRAAYYVINGIVV